VFYIATPYARNDWFTSVFLCLCGKKVFGLSQ
jgi:hypothetical protein